MLKMLHEFNFALRASRQESLRACPQTKLNAAVKLFNEEFYFSISPAVQVRAADIVATAMENYGANLSDAQRSLLIRTIEGAGYKSTSDGNGVVGTPFETENMYAHNERAKVGETLGFGSSDVATHLFGKFLDALKNGESPNPYETGIARELVDRLVFTEFGQDFAALSAKIALSEKMAKRALTLMPKPK